MARIDMIGSEMSIGGGNTEKQDGFGPGVTQMTGDMMSMSRTSRPLGQFTDQPMGAMDFTGDMVPLKRQPHRGYESGTVMNQEVSLPDTPESF